MTFVVRYYQRDCLHKLSIVKLYDVKYGMFRCLSMAIFNFRLLFTKNSCKDLHAMIELIFRFVMNYNVKPHSVCLESLK